VPPRIRGGEVFAVSPDMEDDQGARRDEMTTAQTRSILEVTPQPLDINTITHCVYRAS